jgi:AcrR family transcriptional regulator
MARPRASDYQQQRAQILRHAVEAFAQNGYASAGMLEISKRCGLSKATLYHYYPTKEALLFDALDQHTKALMSLGAQLEQTHVNDEPAIALRELVRGFMRRYRDAHDLHRVLLNGPSFLAPEQQSIIVAQERAVVDTFGRVLVRCFPHSIGENNRFAVSMTLLSALNFSFAWLKNDGPLSHERYADWITDLWLKGAGHTQFV